MRRRAPGRRGRPAAFRVHEPPAPDGLEAAAALLVELGALEGADAAAISLGDPRAIERALEGVHGTGFEELANAVLLRAMQRAIYKPHNEGHYALGATSYCHFTSPIRRYPDLLVHRALKLSLARERLGRRAATERASLLVGRGRDALDAIAPQLCRHASDRERIADSAASATQKIKVAQYYGERVGERFAGTVSWIDQMGVFVRIDGTGAEGLVRMRSLGDEWWDLDERSLALTGASTGRRIALGQRVVVEVARVDVMRGHLDLRARPRRPCATLNADRDTIMTRGAITMDLPIDAHDIEYAENFLASGDLAAALPLLERLVELFEEYADAEFCDTERTQWFSFHDAFERLAYRRVENDPRELVQLDVPVDRLYSALAFAYIRTQDSPGRATC